MTTENTKPMGVFVIRKYKVGREQRSEWMKVGVCFFHKDGPGFNLDLSANSVDGKYTVYPFKDKTEDKPAAEAPPAETTAEDEITY